MRSITVDNLIVGAGPAGCTAGFQLLQKGADTLILERETLEKKNKLCGGVMSKGDFGWLSQLFQTIALPNCTRLDHSFICKNDGELIEGSSGLALLSRKELDDWLVERYIEASGKVLENFHTTAVDTAKKELLGFDRATGEQVVISYRRLLAADGAASIIRRLVTGRIGRSVLALEVEYPLGMGDPAAMFFYYRDLSGYAWYFCRESGANLGIGSYSEQDIPDLEARLKKLAKRLGALYKKPRGALIPFGDDMLPEVGDTLFLGDAGGFIDPLSGGGIHLAIKSGELAAEAILQGKSYAMLMEDNWARRQRGIYLRRAVREMARASR